MVLKMKKTILSLLMLVALASSTPAGENPFHLKKGDRVVFYGDSITDQRLYTTFVETFVVTRFPDLKVSFVHSGWGGDRVSGGAGGGIDLRLQRDVFAYKPTVMTVMLGMNDASYKPFDAETYHQYTNGYQHIVDSVKQNSPTTRMTLVQPSPFDDVTQPPKFEGGYNEVLVRYGDYVKNLASREHLDLADLNTAVVAVQHNHLHFEGWREIQVRLEKHKSDEFTNAIKAVMNAYDTEEGGLVQTQRNTAKPVRHQYELIANN